MIIDGHTRVIGEARILFDWVLRQNDEARRVFEQAEQEKKIVGMSRYFYREVRGNTSQLIRRLGIRVLKPDEGPKPGDAKV